MNQKQYVLYRDCKFSVESRYKIEKVLGKGSYGTVCSAIDSNSEEKLRVAIKKVSRIFERDVLLKRAIRELKLMRHFKGHKNIVNLIDIDIVYTTPYDGLYCMQEMADYDLSKVIYSSSQFSEFHIKNFMYQMLCGLKYIHSADVIHRDLKPGNILVTVHGVLKICDFGLARGININYYQKKKFPQPITNYVATRWYRAPELMLSSKNYGKAVDLWAVGCILCEFYGRKPLFVGKDQMHQINEILKVLGTPNREIINKYGWRYLNTRTRYEKIEFDKIYPFASGYSIHMIDNLLCWDPYERLDVNEALNHPFLKQVKSQFQESVCSKPFDFNFENEAITQSDLKKVLQQEVDSFKLERFRK